MTLMVFFSACLNDGYDYDFYTNTCIRLVNTTQSPVTWTAARQRCKNDGGDLISITTREKVEFVFNYLNCKSFFKWG